MERKYFSTGFYVKLFFIMLVTLWAYQSHRSAIHTILADRELSTQDRIIEITKVLLDLPLSLPDEKPKPTEDNAKMSSSTPTILDAEITQSANYQYAAQIAQDFNQKLSMTSLNEAYISLINKNINPQIQIGPYLGEGTRERVKLLSDYNYFSSQTIDGKDFRTLYPNIPDNQYRIGENVYELFISADDIHLKTWQNGQILAKYLFSQFKQYDNLDEYQHQYLSVYVSPSDYKVEELPYVRMVAVVTYDTN